VLLIVPGDPLRPRRPDPHFAPEAAAARGVGWDVAVVDHDALARAGGAADAVARVPEGARAVYRGWMLSSDRYGDFAPALAARDTTLVTTAEQYRQAHELPGWYEALSPVTPETVWTSGAEREQFAAGLSDLRSGASVLRDYTKSMKHYWHEAAFIPDVADEDAAWRVASRFLELRDDDFTGGFVLRRFEDLTGAELRTWWVDGDCVLSGAHPDTPDQVPGGLDLGAVTPLVKGLDLPFVTVDLARRADGVWRVIELGDAQVSDRPASLDPEAFIAALAASPIGSD
jgi:hypothetical protein